MDHREWHWKSGWGLMYGASIGVLLQGVLFLQLVLPVVYTYLYLTAVTPWLSLDVVPGID